MGVIQLPDELQSAIDRAVEQGRASSAAAFLQEAVARLIDDAQAEEDDIRAAVAEGIAEAEAGLGTLIATQADSERLHARLMERLHGNLAAPM
jgi:Arc/MetJ-type ribon-helix-helix transcriptional regulator